MDIQWSYSEVNSCVQWLYNETYQLLDDLHNSGNEWIWTKTKEYSFKSRVGKTSILIAIYISVCLANSSLICVRISLNYSKTASSNSSCKELRSHHSSLVSKKLNRLEKKSTTLPGSTGEKRMKSRSLPPRLKRPTAK